MQKGTQKCIQGKNICGSQFQNIMTPCDLTSLPLSLSVSSFTLDRSFAQLHCVPGTLPHCGHSTTGPFPLNTQLVLNLIPFQPTDLTGVFNFAEGHISNNSCQQLLNVYSTFSPFIDYIICTLKSFVWHIRNCRCHGREEIAQVPYLFGFFSLETGRFIRTNINYQINKNM